MLVQTRANLGYCPTNLAPTSDTPQSGCHEIAWQIRRLQEWPLKQIFGDYSRQFLSKYPAYPSYSRSLMSLTAANIAVRTSFKDWRYTSSVPTIISWEATSHVIPLESKEVSNPVFFHATLPKKDVREDDNKFSDHIERKKKRKLSAH